MARDVRILSLDGGGVWALLQVKALGSIYGFKTPGLEILRHFQFAFANSGGAIVLAALAENLTPAEILPYFIDSNLVSASFDRKWGFWLRRRIKFLPRYRTAKKAEVMRERLGDGYLATIEHDVDHKTYLAIVGYDYDRERAFLFRSAPSERSGTTHVKLADAVHASSTAPVSYFDAPAEINVAVGTSLVAETMHFWDGAVTGLNNPVAAAVAEALSVGRQAKDIAVLSIGTGNVVLPNTRTKQTTSKDYVVRPGCRGIVATLTRMAVSVIADPPDFASFLAHTSLGGRAPAEENSCPIVDGAVVRLNPLMTPIWNDTIKRWEKPADLDDHEFKALMKLEIDAVGSKDIKLIAKFIDLWQAGMIINQPIRFNFRKSSEGMVAEIGHLDYCAAVERWELLDTQAKFTRARYNPAATE